MNTAHYAHWPAGLPHELNPPETSVYVNLDISARRYPDKAALIFYGREISYRQLQEEVDALAGYLQQVCGIARGDRVLLHMQNCPQFPCY
jgi:fatty-acyl-CoA synthase